MKNNNKLFNCSSISCMCEECKYGAKYKNKYGYYYTCNRNKTKLHNDGYTGITGIPDSEK